MCTCATAKRGRRRARKDKRYQPKGKYNFQGYKQPTKKAKS